VSGVNPPMESKNGPVARRLAGGKETTELTLVGRWIQRRGGYFPLVSALLAAREREREWTRSRTSAIAGRRLGRAVRLRSMPEPLFSVNDGWALVGNLKLARLKWPNGCTVVTLTCYQRLNQFQIELSYKMKKAFFCGSKNSQILHAARLEYREQLSF
jgi:hypothetical protein